MAGSNGYDKNLKAYMESLKAFLRRMREIHDSYRTKRRSSSEGQYQGIPSWTQNEREWYDTNRVSIERLARKLNLTDDQRKDAHSDVVKELESVDETHP